MNSEAKQSPNARPHLSAPELHLLMSDDDASDQFRGAATHLEGCETCQSQLTTLAGDPGWWNDARSLLAGGRQARWEPDLSQSLVFTADATPDRQSMENQVLKLLGSQRANNKYIDRAAVHRR